jgi:hypothetical protein
MTTIFNSSNIALTEEEANEFFLRIEAQGTETFQNVLVNGNLKVNNLTTNRVCITDGSYNLASSTITTDELNNLTGSTSNIQSQLNDKSIVIDSDNAGTQRNKPKPIIVIGENTSRADGTSTITNFFDANLFSVPPTIIAVARKGNEITMIATIPFIATDRFSHRLVRNSGTSGQENIFWVAIGYK